MNNIEKLCAVFLPKNTLDNFDITNVNTDKDKIHITLTEKNNPPKHKKKLIAKGFKSISMSDFPIRGKSVSLTYQRRYWQVAGKKEFVTSDIPLVHTGTKLEQDFAEILKNRSRNNPDFLGEYSDFIQTPDQRI